MYVLGCNARPKVSISEAKDERRREDHHDQDADDAAAAKAIEKFNGKEVNGRALNVNEARSKESGFGGEAEIEGDVVEAAMVDTKGVSLMSL